MPDSPPPSALTHWVSTAFGVWVWSFSQNDKIQDLWAPRTSMFPIREYDHREKIFHHTNLARFASLCIHINHTCGCSRHQNQGVAVLCNNTNLTSNDLWHDCHLLQEAFPTITSSTLLSPPQNPHTTHPAGTFPFPCPSITFFIYLSSSDYNKLTRIIEAPVWWTSWLLHLKHLRELLIPQPLFWEQTSPSSVWQDSISQNSGHRSSTVFPIPPVSIQWV